MFEIGESIIYGTTGVCKIADITTLNMDGAAKDRLYYIMEPVGAAGGKIFTPVDNDKIMMRRVMNREEAMELVDHMQKIEPFGFQSEKQKEEIYKNALKSGDYHQWIRIIKTIYPFKLERQSKGKRLNSVDEKYLKKAEENLYSELSIPLEIPREHMFDYITKRLEELRV